MEVKFSLLFLSFYIALTLAEPLENTNLQPENTSIQIIKNDEVNKKKEPNAVANDLNNYPNFNYFFDFVWNATIKQMQAERKQNTPTGILTRSPNAPTLDFSTASHIV